MVELTEEFLVGRECLGRRGLLVPEIEEGVDQQETPVKNRGGQGGIDLVLAGFDLTPPNR